jgi:hypothetical protein
VRSSLRSKANERGIRELKSWAAEQKASMDKAVATLEKAVAEQRYLTEKAAAEQRYLTEKSATAASVSNGEVKMLLGIAISVLFAGFAFIILTPQRAIAMLRAYIGLQHAPP